MQQVLPSSELNPAHLHGTLEHQLRARLKEIQARKHLWAHDLATYARDALTIRPKDATPRNFILNSVQRKLDAILDNQLAETGMVRALIVKARQMGISTYIESRFYHRGRWNAGIRSLIMTHRDDATDNLKGMVDRYYENDSNRLHASAKNAEELVLENDSGFAVATAGQKKMSGAGRSFTFQNAHISELAYWANASDHLTAVLEAVPRVLGSESHHGIDRLRRGRPVLHLRDGGAGRGRGLHPDLPAVVRA